MDRLTTQSSSQHSAVCSDIAIRDGKQVRLVFRPEIVDNESDPAACVRGRFLYQRKGPHDVWEDFDSRPLSSLRKGERFQLRLKAGELLPLIRSLGALYRVYRRQGVPIGHVEFVKIQGSLRQLLQLGESDLTQLLSANRRDAVETLRRVLKWLSNNQQTGGDVTLPELNALVGLANLRSIIELWNNNINNDDEGFWQDKLARHSFVLSQIFAYPVVVIQGKAYVGGKRLDNAHGNIVDFLAQVPSSGEAFDRNKDTSEAPSRIPVQARCVSPVPGTCGRRFPDSPLSRVSNARPSHTKRGPRTVTLGYGSEMHRGYWQRSAGPSGPRPQALVRTFPRATDRSHGRHVRRTLCENEQPDSTAGTDAVQPEWLANRAPKCS